jgi:predicted transcriptional regulator
MHSNLNYVTCKKYSNLMSVLNWIEIIEEEKNTTILVTDMGKKVMEKLHIFR